MVGACASPNIPEVRLNNMALGVGQFLPLRQKIDIGGDTNIAQLVLGLLNSYNLG